MCFLEVAIEGGAAVRTSAHRPSSPSAFDRDLSNVPRWHVCLGGRPAFSRRASAARCFAVNRDPARRYIHTRKPTKFRRRGTALVLDTSLCNVMHAAEADVARSGNLRTNVSMLGSGPRRLAGRSPCPQLSETSRLILRVIYTVIHGPNAPVADSTCVCAQPDATQCPGPFSSMQLSTSVPSVPASGLIIAV